jgi:hypothetical protein
LPFYKSSPKKTTAQKANIRPILSPCPRSAVFTLYAYIQRHLKDAAARLCGSFNTRFLSVFLSTTPLSLCLCVCTSFYISVLSSSNYSTHVLFRFTFLLFLFSLFFFFLSFYASHETDFSNFLRRFLPLHTYIGTYIHTYIHTYVHTSLQAAPVSTNVRSLPTPECIAPSYVIIIFAFPPSKIFVLDVAEG